tara:strand:+ start:101 stop:421 length:321 start_codon:yes stop_codon:yes gene_type:complete
MKIFLVVVLFFIFQTIANASYIALNASSCGQIISKQDSNTALLQVKYYVTGYITGYNRSKDLSIGDDLQIDEYDSLFWAVVKFCKENPLKDLDDASFNVLSQLRAR